MRPIRRGSLTVIAGPMGSSKSMKLIWMLSQQAHRGRHYSVIKPKDDSRDGASIKSRMFLKPIEADFVEVAGDIQRSLRGAPVLAIDETQFLDRLFLPEIVGLLDLGIIVIACGLDTDFTGRPFGIMPDLLAMADEVIKLKAVCDSCHQENATRTQLIVDPKSRHESWQAYDQRVKPIRDFLEGKSRSLVGNMGMYQSRCPQHHSLPELSQPPLSE